MVNRQTIRRKIFHLVLSGVLLFSLGAVVLSPQPVSAAGEYALSFNGTTDYVDCETDASLDITEAITIEAWVKITDNSGDRAIVDKRIGVTEMNYLVRLRNGYLKFTFYNGGYRDLQDDTTLLANNTFYYIAVTYDRANIRLYVNGAEVKSVAETDAMIPDASPLTIGRQPYNNSAHFSGLIDEVRISNVALTPGEISDNWDEGNGKKLEVDAVNTAALWHMDEGIGGTIFDETTNDNDGTISGADWIAGFQFPAEEGPEGPVELWRAGSWVEDYGAIQPAINAAEVGDIIIVHGGTYNEHLFIDKTLTLKSIEGVVIIDGQSLASGPSWQVEGDVIIYPVVWIDAYNVVFGVDEISAGGFTVKNAAPWEEIYEGEEFWGYSVGIAVFIHSYDCVIENNFITNDVGTNIVGLSVKGDDNQILSNEFPNNGMTVLVDRGGGNIVGGNLFYDNGVGVMFSDGPGGTVEGNYFYSNFTGI